MLDPQFVIDETEPEQPKAARKPSADRAREWLRRRFRSIMREALIWNEIWSASRTRERTSAA